VSLDPAASGPTRFPAFLETMRMLRSQRQDWPRRILSDDGYFVVL
jgi:hypothetical protein